MEYTAVIRTLGTGGEKYQKLLNSLHAQTLTPQKILVYIAEGYPIPKETIGIEQYIYVKKGMVAQRALPYDEVNTEYILFLDDDLYLPPDTVELMFVNLQKERADVISPDILPNDKRPFVSNVLFSLSGRIVGRYGDDVWGYKVMPNTGYSYNAVPKKECYQSQTNAGACFLCKKSSFMQLKFEEELWLDKMQYAIGDDQVMYSKMYCHGLKQITWYKHGIIHLDGGNNMSTEKEYSRVQNDIFFKVVFWHRFIFLPEKNTVARLYSVVFFIYTIFFILMASVVRCNFKMLNLKLSAIENAVHFCRSEEYRSIPVVVKSV